MTGVGMIVQGGFALLSRRPGAVAAWAAIQAVSGLLGALLALQMLPAMFESIEQMQAAGPGSPPMAMMAEMQGLNALSWLLSIASYFISALLLCAAFRAVLRPEQGGFASLRIGMDELRTFLIALVLWFAGIFLGMVVALLAMLIVLAVGIVARDAPAITVLFGVALGFAVMAAAIYVAVRLSLIFAISFLRGRLTIDEAWAVTRGRFWTLFLAYLVIWVVTAVVSALVFVPFGWLLFSTLPPELWQPGTVMPARALADWFAGNTAIFAVLAVLSSALHGAATGVIGGAMATAAAGFLADDGRPYEDVALPG